MLPFPFFCAPQQEVEDVATTAAAEEESNEEVPTEEDSEDEADAAVLDGNKLAKELFENSDTNLAQALFEGEHAPVAVPFKVGVFQKNKSG